MAGSIKLGHVRGAPGPQGETGPQGAAGTPGASAYEQAVEAGYTGTEAEFGEALKSLDSAPFLPLTGGTLTGTLYAPSVAAVGDGVLDMSALNVTGSFTTDGDIQIDLNGCRVEGVSEPVSGTDAVNKGYVDVLVGDIDSALDAINGEAI